MYSCDEVIAELAGYLDEDMTADVRREVELHLAHCKTCRVVYDSVRKTLKILTESGSFELPERVSARIVARIMDKIRQCGGDGSARS